IILGLPGETPADAWMTVDLIDRMEQIPNGHFVTAPLTFVPIGVLRGEQFYNLDEMIDEARFNVAYRAWRHILLEVDKDLWRLTALPVPLRAMIVLTARVGGRYILDIMHRFARSKGFRIRAPAKTRRQAEGHTVSFPAAGEATSNAGKPLRFETRGDGLATDLSEAEGAVQVRRGIVPDRDVEGEAGLVSARESAHRSFEERPPDPAPSAVLRDAEFRDERHPHPMGHEDRADDPVAFERHIRGIGQILSRVTFEQASHVAAPLFVGSGVHAELLLDMALVRVNEKLRQTEDLVLLRRLQRQAFWGRGLAGRSLHPYAGEHAAEPQRDERGLVSVLEMRDDRRRSAGAKKVHRLQEDRRRLGGEGRIDRESGDLGRAEAKGSDDPAVLLRREVGALLLRSQAQVPVQVDLEIPGRKVGAAGEEDPPIGMGLRRLQWLELQRHPTRESLAGHQGAAAENLSGRRAFVDAHGFGAHGGPRDD